MIKRRLSLCEYVCVARGASALLWRAAAGLRWCRFVPVLYIRNRPEPRSASRDECDARRVNTLYSDPRWCFCGTAAYSGSKHPFSFAWVFRLSTYEIVWFRGEDYIAIWIR